MGIDYRQHPVLVVDDEPDLLHAFRLNYDDDFTVLTAEGGEAGLAQLAEHDVAVIVADQRMPGMSGTEFLERSMAVRPDAIRIILTGYSDLESIVRAVNAARIFQYLTKPCNDEAMRHTLARAMEVFHLGRENARLLEELARANARLSAENSYLRAASVASSEIVGDSAAIRAVLGLIAKVGPSNSRVLIEGETGTGKELVARAIHAASPRRDALFVAVNCAALAEGLLESELFGHKRGAFTGADRDRKGLFEIADKGTLFLDEVGEMPLGLQAKLLRALQEGEVRPVGENTARKVDVRVVAATNRRLEDEVRAGRFREDLYFRLCVFPIALPPLRDRVEDIAPLTRHLLPRLAQQLGKAVGAPSPELLAALERYPFRGNVRELTNELERVILMADAGAELGEDLLSDHILAQGGAPAGPFQRKTEEFEREQITQALAEAQGVKARAADLLGITYRGLQKKMKRLGMA